jgi:pyruvate formate lyase activating enzyme
MEQEISGRIHSVETFGAVDGPGIRFVVFFQGCSLRCLYCHNPDSWNLKDGKEITAKQIVEDISSYHNFIKKGGVTLSGGEPLLQPEFAYEVLKGCKELGLHTAVDTAGSIPLIISKKIIDIADMLLLDIKSYDTFMSATVTGSKTALEMAKKTLEYCESINKPVWIRHVLVSYYTMNEKLLEDLAFYLKDFKCIKRVELLPFHKMGEYKWEQLNYDYKLKDVPPTSSKQYNIAAEIFKKYGLIK